ncbi:MAG: hypothetical protein PWP24_97 [Clostridiales bacterium]|nr:hypothetical protein [Clostridiales bacterium]
MDSFYGKNIDEIKNEYSKIDKDWLILHYKISVGVVIFAFLAECIMGVFIINSDLLTTTVARYIEKYILIPSGINAVFMLGSTLILRSRILSQMYKSYMISSNFAVVCFVLFTAHSAFTATYYIFSGAIMLTIIYASYEVTLLTAILSMGSMIISELFIVWDSDKVTIYESTFRLSNFLVNLILLVAFTGAAMVAIHYEQRKNRASIQLQKERYDLEKRIQADELTGISSRTALYDAMRVMEDNSSEKPCIFAIVDLDQFKRVNQTYGRGFGDECLIQVAKLLRMYAGKATPFRYGADEFCLLFRDAKMKEAILMCKKIQVELAKLRFREAPELRLTVSIGLSSYQKGWNAVKLFVYADQALYEAKKVGNAIEVFEKEDIEPLE